MGTNIGILADAITVKLKHLLVKQTNKFINTSTQVYTVNHK